MSAGKIVLLVFGVIIVVVAVGLVFGGGSLMWLERTHGDGEGFLASDTIDIERNSYAVVTGPIELDDVALDVLDWMGIATAFGVEASNNDPSKQIFLGIAEESDVESYLDDVTYDEMTLADGCCLSFRPSYTTHAGTSQPGAPASQDFWSVRALGDGTQAIEWETEVGSYSIVLMNGDGSAGLDLDAVFKVKVPDSLFAISLGLLVGGILALLLGTFMIIWAVRRPRRARATGPDALGAE